MRILIDRLSPKIVLWRIWSAMQGMRHNALMEGLNRSADEIRTIDVERPIIARELLTMRDVSCCFTNLNLMDWRSGNRSDVFRRNAGVDDGVVSNVDVIDDRGVAVKPSHFSRSDAVAAGIWITKVPRPHKCEHACVQTKIKPDADVATLKNDPDARSISRVWRQRRPAAIIAGITPRDP
jgi:hypothetical protein